MNKIAIQGIKGSNHHQVAINHYHEPIEVVECSSFDQLVNELIQESADEGIMAIENSIAGSIIPNYNLIYENRLHINGEYYLDIHHHLMAIKGTKLEDIKEVHSHPMALLQCKDFFNLHPNISQKADIDTAASAKNIRDNDWKNIGALAPQVASELYDLNIIQASVQSTRNNETRFFFVSKQKKTLELDKIDKVSLRFVADHKRGSLATILNVMSDCRLNLTKIQSLPILKTPWKYSFFVDVTFDEYAHFIKAKSLLELMADEFLILGEYKKVKQ